MVSTNMVLTIMVLSSMVLTWSWQTWSWQTWSCQAWSWHSLDKFGLDNMVLSNMVLTWLVNHGLDMVLILFSNNLLAVLDWLSILFRLAKKMFAYHTSIDVCAIRMTEAHNARIISPLAVWPTLACNTNKHGSNSMIDNPRASDQLGLIQYSCGKKSSHNQ